MSIFSSLWTAVGVARTSERAAALPRLTRQATQYAGVAGAALVKAQLRLEALGAGEKG